MKKLILSLVTFVFSCVHAQEMIDVESLPTLRTHQYSALPYKKIVVFSAPRSGSSLTYNLFHFLFEDDSKLFAHHYQFNSDRVVLKTHRFYELDLIKDETDVLYIFPMRNPIDACISNYRIHPHPISDNKAFAHELLYRQLSYFQFSETLEAKGYTVAHLKYEDFAENIDHLFNCIENNFQISIDPKDKELMRAGYCKENVYSNIQKFIDFNDYFPVSGFHGKHVTLEEYNAPEEFVFWLKVLFEQNSSIFNKYGYYLNSI